MTDVRNKVIHEMMAGIDDTYGPDSEESVTARAILQAARATPADHSVPVAKVGPGIGIMANCIRWTDMEAMDRLPIGTVLYAHTPQTEAKSVRDALAVDLPSKQVSLGKEFSDVLGCRA